MEKWNELSEDDKYEIYDLLFKHYYIGCNTPVNFGSWDELSNSLKNKIKKGFIIQEIENSPFYFI
jgi:hypothetical protein